MSDNSHHHHQHHHNHHHNRKSRKERQRKQQSIQIQEKEKQEKEKENLLKVQKYGQYCLKHNDIEDLLKNSFQDTEWELVHTTELNTKVMRKISGDGCTNFRRHKLIGKVEYPAHVLYSVFRFYTERLLWNSWLNSLTIVDKIDLPNNEDGTKNPQNTVFNYVLRYPWPLYPRDYCVYAASLIDVKRNFYAMMSRSGLHEKVPENSNYVRANINFMGLVCIPDKNNPNSCTFYSLNEIDPKGYVPPFVVNWVVTKGVAEFEKVMREGCAMYDKIIEVRKNKNEITDLGDDYYLDDDYEIEENENNNNNNSNNNNNNNN